MKIQIEAEKISNHYRVNGTHTLIHEKYCTVLDSFSSKTEQVEQWVPKVGEWAYVESNRNNHSNLRKGECFKIEEISVQEYNAWLRPNYGLTTGVSISSCRKALPNEMPQPEPKGYCIKRTPENAEVLNKWANIGRVDSFYFNNTNLWVCSTIPKGMEDYLKPLIVNNVPDGFCILNTVEEFFAKVGYTPEPKLIAKTGECNEWCGLNHCDTNGCSNRERILVEPVQVDTPIEARKHEFTPFTDILKTIALIRDSFEGSEIVYTQGSCVKLAMILNHIYPKGVILYDLSHAIFEFNGKCYDINGFAEKNDCHIPIQDYGVLAAYKSMNLKYIIK